MAAHLDRNGAALRLTAAWLWLLPIAFLTLFFVYPLVSIFAISLAPAGQLDLSGFVTIATSSYYWNTLGFTIGQAALSTLITLALALPGAYVFTRYQFPGKALLAALAGLPFVLPTVVVAAAFLALIGPRGIINTWLISVFALDAPPIQLERTVTLIIIAHIFYNYGVAFRMLQAFWASQSTRIEEASRALGVAGWRLWWRIRLAMLRPALIAAAAIVFIYNFTSFGVIVIIGGARFATLEVEIYRQIANLFDLPTAAALSLVQIVFMFVCLLVFTRLERTVRLTLRGSKANARPPRRAHEWALLLANVGFILTCLAAPLLALVLRAFTAPSGELTLAYFTGLTSNPRGSVLNAPPTVAIGNSLAIAAVAIIIALATGTLIAWLLYRQRARHWIEPLLMLPLATSAVVLGFGYNVALDTPPLDLRSSPLLVPMAHALVALPFVIRSITPVLRGIPPNLYEVARSLGTHGWGIFRRVQFPIVRRVLASSAIFAFTISMGEFGATLFVARPDAPTLPIAIFRLLGQPGEANYGRAIALSTLLLAICGLAFLMVEWVRDRGSGDW
jgi:thiamine transport system permease protein